MLPLLALLWTCASGLAQNSGSIEDANRRWLSCATSGKASCQYSLGRALLMAKPPDPQTGISWLSKAAAQNHAEAQNRLGLSYLRGEFVKRDYAEARKYFETAAKNGSYAAKANIGLLHWRGYGVTQNLEEAFAWSEISAAGVDFGAKQRDEILSQMAPDQWTRGRDRAAELRKQFIPKSTSSRVDDWFEIIEFVFVLVALVAVVWSIIDAQRKRKRAEIESRKRHSESA